MASRTTLPVFPSLLEGSERRDKPLIALSEDFNVTRATVGTDQRSEYLSPVVPNEVRASSALHSQTSCLFCLELSIIKEGMKKHIETSFGPM